MSIDKEKKSNRLLASRRYTHDTFTDAQESFTNVLDLQASEVYTQAHKIPSTNLPFSGSSQQSQIYTDGADNILRYYYRHKLTKSNLNNEVWFFLNPTGSASGIGAQLIDSNQQTSFISPKYSDSTLANATAEDSTPGYLAKVFISTAANSASVSDSDVISVNDYTFDYKTGVLQFTDGTVDPSNSQYVYMSVNQYVGKTLADGIELTGDISGSASSTGSFGHLVVAGNISASGVVRADAFESVTGGDTIDFKDSVSVTGDVNADNLTADSSSFSTRVTNLKTNSGSFSTRTTLLEISASNLTADSSSFSTRVTNLKTNSGSFSTRITNLVADSASFSTRITVAEGELENTLISASKQLEQQISGSFTAPSASFSNRLTTEEANVDALQSDSGSFSTRVTDLKINSGSFSTRITTDSSSFSTRTTLVEISASNLVDNSGSFSTRLTNLKADSGSFSTRITNFTTGNVELVSGSLTSTGSFGKVVTTDLLVSGESTLKNKVTIKHDSSNAILDFRSTGGSRINDIHNFNSTQIYNSLFLSGNNGVIAQDGTYSGGNTRASIFSIGHIDGTLYHQFGNVNQVAKQTGMGILDYDIISGSAVSTGSFGHVKIPDDGRLSIGNSNDLQLYHNGNHSFIKDGGSGNLILLASAFQVKNSTNNETMIQANEDGAVTLFYDNTQRLVTTPSGLNLTGNITGSGNLKIDGNIFGTNLLADSASFSTRITVAEGELENTLISASNQLEEQISGSFTAPSASFSARLTTEESNVDALQVDSSSFSTRITDLKTDSGSFSDRLTNPSVVTLTASNDVHFKQDLVVDGKVTAQEFHTEIVSSSIVFTSGSTKFGDSSDDKHSFTGSINLKGSEIFFGTSSNDRTNVTLKGHQARIQYRHYTNNALYTYLNLASGGSILNTNFANSVNELFKIQANETTQWKFTTDIISGSNQTTASFHHIHGASKLGVGTLSPLATVHISASDGLIIPVGTNAQRSGDAVVGEIRFNTDAQTYEGYDGNNWGSLGGMNDVDQDTKITAETSAGADNDELQFFTAGTERLRIFADGHISASGNITASKNLQVDGDVTTSVTSTGSFGLIKENGLDLNERFSRNTHEAFELDSNGDFQPSPSTGYLIDPKWELDEDGNLQRRERELWTFDWDSYFSD